MSNPIPKQPRIESKKYRKWIRTHNCVNCDNPETVAHHILKYTDGGKGLKPSDFCCVPLCHHCHMAIHNGHEPDKSLTLAAGFLFGYLETNGHYKLVNDHLRAIGLDVKREIEK